MADTTLNDVIGALREGNGNEQTQALLERVAAGNASIVERLTRSEAETQRRYQDEKSARENAEKDAENARNEAALAAKNEKKKAGGSGGVGGFFKDQKESVSKMGGGDFGLGLAIGATRLSGIGIGLAGLAGLTLDPKTITDIGENAQKAQQVLQNTSKAVNDWLKSIEVELPPLSVIATDGNKKISNSLDGILALQEGDTKTFIENSSDTAQVTAGLGKGLQKIAADGKGVSQAVAKGAVALGDTFPRAVASYTGQGVAFAGGALADKTGRIVGSTDDATRKKTQERILKGLTATEVDELDKMGYKVAKDGTLRNKGSFMNVDDVDKALKTVGAKTSANRVTSKAASVANMAGKVTGMVPKSVTDNLAKIAKVPGLSQALAAVGIYDVMMNPNLTEDQRYNQTVKVLAGLGGATLGGFVGALGGALGLGPLGALAGGLALGIYGGIAGEQLAEPLAQALLGLPIDLPAGIEKLSNLTQSVANSNIVGGVKGAYNSASNLVGGVADFFKPDPNRRERYQQRMSAGRKTMGEDIASGQAQYAAASGASGSPMVISDTSQKITNVGGATAYQSGNGLSSGDPFTSGTSNL